MIKGFIIGVLFTMAFNFIAKKEWFKSLMTRIGIGGGGIKPPKKRTGLGGGGIKPPKKKK